MSALRQLHRLVLLVLTVLSLAAPSVLADCEGVDCRHPKAKISGPGEPPAKFNISCGDVTAGFGVSLYGSGASLHITAITWTVEGSTGATITPDPDGGTKPAFATLTIPSEGGKPGSGTVKVSVTYVMDNPCCPPADGPAEDTFAFEVTKDENGCGSCNGGGDDDGSNPGSGSCQANSVHVSLGLGRYDQFVGAGLLTVDGESPVASLASPAGLKYNYNRANVFVATSGGNITQVKTPQALAMVVDTSPTDNKYDIQFYYAQDVTYNSGTHLYAPNSGITPFVTWTFSNPSGNVNILQVSNTRGETFTYTYSTTTGKWTLAEPGSLRTIDAWMTTSGSLTDRYREIKSGSTVVSRTWREFQTIGGVARLAKVVAGNGSTTETTQYTLITTGDGTGQPSRIDYPDGRWEMYAYDSAGRITEKYEAYADMAAPSAGSYPSAGTCRKTTYSYDALNSADLSTGGLVNPYRSRETIGYAPYYDTTAMSWSWVEVSHRYFWAEAFDTTVEAVSVTPGSSTYDDTANLVTTTVIYTDPTDAQSYTRTKLRIRPDGTGSLFTYTVDGSGNTLTTESSGELNSGLTAVVNGTQTVTTRNPLGRLVSIVTKYIVGGASPSIVLSQQTYSYSGGSLLEDYSVTDLAGRTTQYDFSSCCGRLDSEADPDGRTLSYTYDALYRKVATTYQFGSASYVITNSLDVAGRVLMTQRLPGGGGAAQTLDQNLYDVLGRVTSNTNALNGITAYAYDAVNHKVTTTYPDSGTQVQEYFLDGRIKKLSGTAVLGMRYVYAIQPDGPSSIMREGTQEIRLDGSGSDTSEWTLTTRDDLGRELRTYFAKSGSTYPYRETAYNAFGQIVRQTDPDGVSNLYAYDSQGRRGRTATDLNGNGQIDETDGNTGSPDDRITDVVKDVLASGAGGNSRGVDIVRLRTFVFSADDATTTNLVAMTETSTDGRKEWSTLYRDTAGGTPVTTYSLTGLPSSGARTNTVTNPDGSSSEKIYAYGRLTTARDKNSGGSQIISKSYSYDTSGRVAAETDARNGTTSYAYNNGDQVTSSTAPSLGTGEAAQVTTSYFDTRGRLTGMLLPDGTTTTNLYFVTSLLQKTWGSRKYPVEYTYDGQGRMKTMKTWQNFAANSQTAITTWNYDAYRGWLQSKYFPNSSTGAAGTAGVTYTCTDGGRLLTRTWQRGVVTTYEYKVASGSSYTAGDLRLVSYSSDPASTPSTTYTYDRRGRRATVVRNGITTTLSYNEADEPLSESYSGGTLGSLSTVHTYDSQLRLSEAQAKRSSTYLQRAGYTYDTAGRLDKVQDMAPAPYYAQYSYLGNSRLIASVAYTNTTLNSGLVTTRSYDSLNRLTAISSQAYVGSSATGAPIGFAYQYNQANQRTRMDQSDGSYWIYQYDSLGQVVSGKRYWNDGTAVAGQQFEYAFDDIGNRKTTGGRASAVSTYTSDYQNRLSSHGVAGTVDVMGVANPTASVTVNSSTANRHGEYFHYPLAVNNSSAAQYTTVTAVSTYGATQTSSGKVFLPTTTESFTYDSDGNPTVDGRWTTLVWDGENRLIEMRRDTGTPTGAQQKLTFEYDHQGRRIRKTYFTWVSSAWSEQRDTTYLYDGWNLVAELDANNSNATERTYVWGSDLSGNMAGAGGVGGLLWVNNSQSTYNGLSVPTGVHFAAYDGNGNVAGLVDTVYGAANARYEYGPFGEPVRATGTLADANPMRWSTKVTDDESGLVYYGYRYYAPLVGRWYGRDPIGERGGKNIFAINSNNAIGRVDYLGLTDFGYPDPDGTDEGGRLPDGNVAQVTIELSGKNLCAKTGGGTVTMTLKIRTKYAADNIADILKRVPVMNVDGSPTTLPNSSGPDADGAVTASNTTVIHYSECPEGPQSGSGTITVRDFGRGIVTQKYTYEWSYECKNPGWLSWVCSCKVKKPFRYSVTKTSEKTNYPGAP